MAKSSRGKVGASKRAAEKGSKDASTSAHEPGTGVAVASWIPIALIVVSAVTALLAVYQWRELITVQAGGSTFCSINSTFNCSSVWESSFAKTIHAVTRVPVSGWGLVWSFAALASSIAVYMAEKSGKLGPRVAAPLWVVCGVGVVTCVVLLGISTSLGVFCITCIATYVLVAALAFLTLKLPRPSSAELVPGVARSAIFVVAGYLLVLYPGLSTPVESPQGAGIKPVAKPEDAVKKASGEVKSTGDLLGDYLTQLPDNVKAGVAEALAAYRAPQPPVDTSKWTTRRMLGASTAKVRIVEFSDIRCGHCKMFSEALSEMTETAPPGAFSLELRQFPIDAGCNPNVSKNIVDPTGARCTAAKALICMEPLDGFRRAQEKMFAEQDRLTRDRVMEIALANGAQLENLMRCIDSPDTAAKLAADIEYAMAYHIEGTPLVIVNGKDVPGVGQFVYALVLAGGDPTAPGWNVLPPAPPPGAHQH